MTSNRPSDQDSAQSTSTNNSSALGRQVFRAASVVAIAFILSRIIGLIRDVVIANYFGVDTVEANAYALANRFPDLIFNVVVGGALGSAFIPTFSAYFTRDDERGAWRLFSAIVNLVLMVTTVLALLSAIFAESIVRLLFIAPSEIERLPELLPVTVRMMRVMLLSPIIFGVSGVCMGALNARQHFLTPALAATIYNVGIILGVVLWAPDVMGMAYGTVVGALGHLFIQIPTLRHQSAHYEFVLNIRDPGVRRVLWLMAPRVLGLSFSYLNRIVIPILTRPLAFGSLVALDLGFRILSMPYSILGQSVGVAAFPTLATLAAESNWNELRRIVASSMRSLLFLGLPLTAALMLLREPAVKLLFERGAFDEQATLFVSTTLLFYALALVALATLEVVSRTFYALGDTVTPVIAGMIQLPLMAIMSAVFAYQLFPLLGWLPLGGIALGFSLSNILEVGVLMWLLRRRIGGLDGGYLLDGLWRMMIAVSLMSVIVWGLLQLSLMESAMTQILVSGVVGGLVYAVAGWFLGLQELRRLVSLIRSRLGR